MARVVCDALLPFEDKAKSHVRMSVLKRYTNIKWTLFLYDIVILFLVDMLLLVFSGEVLSEQEVIYHMAVG